VRFLFDSAGLLTNHSFEFGFQVADFDNNRIQIISTSGGFVREIGKEGSGPGEFHGPSNVTVNETGSIIVTDMLNGRIQQLAPDGTYMRDLKGPADDEILGTVGLSAISDDEIVLTETEGHRVMVSHLGHALPGCYCAKNTRTVHLTSACRSYL
jgi:hypothetical protein